MMGTVRRLLRATDGAVAPTVALSMVGLIVAGGIAFDYAQLASLDTELQNAADQAALAAASQLDGQAGACERAVAAARELVTNRTVVANDGNASGATVTIAAPTVCGGDTSIAFDAGASIRFYQDDGKTTPADDDSNARFVEVTVDPRKVNYALTPIVGAISSPNLKATAFAGLRESICNSPPVMMCNPSEPVNNADPDYPFTASGGDGVRLVIGSATAPGNFGFLQTGYGTGAADLARALGYNNPPADCAPTNGVSTEPGVKQSVRAAFNTRFDLSESGQTCPAGGTCSPSRNVRKDLVRGNNCSSSGNQGWQISDNPYLPTSPTLPLDGSSDPAIMGHPRDMCHAVSEAGACETDGNTATVGDIIGTGDWDRDAYFRVNYGWNHATWMSTTGLGADATRYQVYRWELDHAAQSDMVQTIDGKTGHSAPVCRPPGVTPGPASPDRRSFPVAVINCRAHGLAGRETGVQVLTWMDVFLVEPAFRRPGRTDDGDIYVEVIGETNVASTGSLQVVKKAVPYLIE